MFEQIVHALEDFCSTSRLAAALFDKDDNCVKCLGDKGCMPARVQTMQQKIRDTCFHAEPYENGSCIACRLSIQRWWVMFWTLPSPASKLESIACCYVRLLQSILAVHIHAQPGILPSPSLMTGVYRELSSCWNETCLNRLAWLIWLIVRVYLKHHFAGCSRERPVIQSPPICNA